MWRRRRGARLGRLKWAQTRVGVGRGERVRLGWARLSPNRDRAVARISGILSWCRVLGCSPGAFPSRSGFSVYISRNQCHDKRQTELRELRVAARVAARVGCVSFHAAHVVGAASAWRQVSLGARRQVGRPITAVQPCLFPWPMAGQQDAVHAKGCQRSGVAFARLAAVHAGSCSRQQLTRLFAKVVPSPGRAQHTHTHIRFVWAVVPLCCCDKASYACVAERQRVRRGVRYIGTPASIHSLRHGFPHPPVRRMLISTPVLPIMITRQGT